MACGPDETSAFSTWASSGLSFPMSGMTPAATSSSPVLCRTSGSSWRPSEGGRENADLGDGTSAIPIVISITIIENSELIHA